MLKQLVMLSCLATSLMVGWGCTAAENDSIIESVHRAPTPPSAQVKNNLPKIRLEFVIDREDKEQYPDLLNKFGDALDIWIISLPIDVVLYVTDDVPRIMAISPGLIWLNFMEDIPNVDDVNRIGTFNWQTRELRLDVADLYAGNVLKSVLAKNVSMHELGHLFGLPHVFNDGDLMAPPGALIVSEGAEDYLMFHVATGSRGETLPSEMELRMATLFVYSHLSDKLRRF